MAKTSIGEDITAEEDFEDLHLPSSIPIDVPLMAKTADTIGETPHRCHSCNRLLFKGSVGKDGNVSVKCRCGVMNTFRIHSLTDPMVNFQDKIYHNRAGTKK